MNIHSSKFKSLLFILVFAINSCGDDAKSKSSTSESAEFETAKNQMNADVNALLSSFPPPSEIPYLLMATGSDFDGTAVNEVSKVDDYTREITKSAINIGIYTTDIGYLISYDKTQLALEYIGACQKLSEAVGVNSVVNLEFMLRFEQNLLNKDSLKTLVDEVSNQSNKLLESTGRLDIASLILSGSVVEGLYISTQLIKNYPEDTPSEIRDLILEPLIKVVIDQKEGLDNLIQIVKKFDDNQTLSSLLMDLNKIKTIYDNELVEISAQIASNKGDMMLQSKVLDHLTVEISRIRNSFVQ
ncbi:MAG: hypothetical protein P8N26_11725 [Cyclobacteriaceae bacterium]|nr:hypothetical protein [Flammeovirgaceae bacterium]MDG1106818.1 hypothetical protein [Cyclobacteriaceae bacterium]